MKKILYSVALAACCMGTMTSCSDFLDASNKSNVTDKQTFATKEGFNSLVNDAYQHLQNVYTPIKGSPDVLFTCPVTVSCANAHETFIRKRAINKANGLSLAFFNCTLHINLDFLKVSFYQILI